MPVGEARHADALDELARRAVLLAVGEEEILERDVRAARGPRRSVSAAPSAISAGGRSPIGEPLAMLPPTVPALRIWMRAEAAHQLAEIGMEPGERRGRVAIA